METKKATASKTVMSSSSYTRIKLWTHGTEGFEFPFRANFDHDRALARVSGFPVKGHRSGDAIVFFDRGQRIPDCLPIFLQVPAEALGILDRVQQETDAVPGQRANGVGFVTVFFIVTVDEFLGRPFGPNDGIVCAEEGPLAVVTAEIHQFGRIPGIASQDRLLPSHLMGLFHDQGDLIVILRGEQDVGL